MLCRVALHSPLAPCLRHGRLDLDGNVDGEKAVRVTPNKQGDWIAVPVLDAGVPREWVDAARAATEDNVVLPARTNALGS